MWAHHGRPRLNVPPCWAPIAPEEQFTEEIEQVAQTVRERRPLEQRERVRIATTRERFDVRAYRASVVMALLEAEDMRRVLA